MRPLATLSAAALLTACASEPPLQFDGAPPATVAGLAERRIGPYALDRLPTRTWDALTEKQPFQKISRRGSIVRIQLPEGLPFQWLFYVADGAVGGDGYEQRALLYSAAEFDEALDQDELHRELAAIGLAPVAVAGLDREDSLVLATASPEWLLRSTAGKLRTALRGPAGAVARDVLEVRDLDDLRAMAGDQGERTKLLKLLAVAAEQPAIDDAAWRAGVTALGDEVYEGIVAPLRSDMRSIDARMQQATTLAQRLKVFADMHRIVRRGRVDDGVAIPPVMRWADGHKQAFFAEMDRVFGGEAKKSTAVWGVYRFMREALDFEKTWLGASDKPPQWHAYQPGLEFAEQWARIRDDNPYREFSRRLRWLYDAPVPRSTRRYYYAEASRGRLVELRRAAGATGFEAEAIEMLAHATFPNKARMRAWAAAADDLGAMLAMTRTHGDLAAACRVAGGVKAADDMDVAVFTRICGAIAERFEALAGEGDDIERAVARAIAGQLRAGEVTRSPLEAMRRARKHVRLSLSKSSELLAAARALPKSGPLEQRLAAFSALANRSATFGPVAERLARELSVPAGRALAEEAEGALRSGDTTRAAILYLRAATLGSRTAPASVSSWQARRDWTALRRAEQEGALEGRDERRDWLTRARIHAYVSTVVALPRLDPQQPIHELQDRYVKSQLAGRSRLSTAFGVRLSGMDDVRRGRQDAENVQLFATGDGVAWRPAGSDGDVVDLADHRIDADGWRELRRRRVELDQVDADLTAARGVGGSSKDQLRQRDAALTEQARALSEQLRNGQIDPGVARGQIDRLKRESNALNAAIANFNDRSRHINSLVGRFNELVAPHNALLERLLAELARAYAQLLQPATTRWCEARVAAGNASPQERAARRWLLGLDDDAAIAAELPQPHPDALAQRVRDVSDPALAAADILGALRRRRDDHRLWQGVSIGEHVEALRAAFVAHGNQYGVDELFDRVMKDALVPPSEYGRVVGFFADEKRRNALRRLVDGK